MKVIEHIEIEYVVPETPEEQAEIEGILAEVSRDEQAGIRHLDNLKLVRKHGLPPEGTWRAKS